MSAVDQKAMMNNYEFMSNHSFGGGLPTMEILVPMKNIWIGETTGVSLILLKNLSYERYIMSKQCSYAQQKAQWDFLTKKSICGLLVT